MKKAISLTIALVMSGAMSTGVIAADWTSGSLGSGMLKPKSTSAAKTTTETAKAEKTTKLKGTTYSGKLLGSKSVEFTVPTGWIVDENADPIFLTVKIDDENKILPNYLITRRDMTDVLFPEITDDDLAGFQKIYEETAKQLNGKLVTCERYTGLSDPAIIVEMEFPNSPAEQKSMELHKFVGKQGFQMTYSSIGRAYEDGVEQAKAVFASIKVPD